MLASWTLAEKLVKKLLDKAYRFLSFRPRSEKEIKNYLKKKKAPDKIAQKIIDELKKQKLIDDLEFAYWWVEQRNTFRPKGKIALQVELRQKGVDREIAQRVIDETVDEFALAKKVFQKKKAPALLARRGFSWATIKKVLDKSAKKE